MNPTTRIERIKALVVACPVCCAAAGSPCQARDRWLKRCSLGNMHHPPS